MVRSASVIPDSVCVCVVVVSGGWCSWLSVEMNLNDVFDFSEYEIPCIHKMIHWNASYERWDAKKNATNTIDQAHYSI